MMAYMSEVPSRDPFSAAVDKARQRLSYTRGRNISVRTLARQAGIPESTLAYNLSAKRAAEGRRVDADIVRKLAAVLPIPEADLMRAAGYVSDDGDVVDSAQDLLANVRAFYRDADIDRGQRDKVTASILRIIADHMQQ
ncbi:MAG TPA: helix-turn-helix transcriptional regulator [Isosphaeraceae bacterium]|jgi:transcriptional regulator with XRE-family HTH domain